VAAFGVWTPPGYASGGGGALPGITITSNAGFQTCGCVVSGSGTASKPYVIGPWSITSPNSLGSAITIENTTAAFTVTGISVGYNDSNPSDITFHLLNVQGPATISNVSANGDGTGVEIDSSSNISLNQVSVNKLLGAGLVINNSSHVTTANGKYKATADGESPHNEDGLYAVNSSFVSIGGVSACPQSTVCNTFDYDSGYGVYLQNTNNVTINNASANADDTGSYILDGSNTYNVNLTNSTGEGGGPICITVNGVKTPTGYYDTDLVGGVMLINGAHNNTVSGDNFTGMSSLSGDNIVSGGNPFYYNVCTGADMTPFQSPLDGPMGPNNNFSNNCYSTTDIAGLPPSTCKS
jgi:hypothetical protein